MGTLTIRNLDDSIKQKLRERAAAHGVSMEQEARTILRLVVERDPGETAPQVEESLMASVDRLKSKYGAFDIELPERSKSVREPPTFD
jgi:antitoxin FitA